MRSEIDTPIAPASASKPPPADKSVLSPLNQSMVMTHEWGSDILVDKDLLQVEDVRDDMRAHIAAVRAGDMGSIEAALIGQAETLAAMFTGLQKRARDSGNIERFRVFATLALKAQAQSRATYETIAEIRNPRRVLIAKQANIAHQQMVSNNDTTGVTLARTGTNANAPIELLEEPHGYSLDASTARTPVGTDARAATVGKVDRAAHTRGEGHRVKKRVQGRLAAPDA